LQIIKVIRIHWFSELIPFRKERLYKENGNEIDGDWLPPFDFRKDYFNEFDKEGYTNFEMKIILANKINLN
jgi:hypothetical protein